jgi:hypothetical protein
MVVAYTHFMLEVLTRSMERRAMPRILAVGRHHPGRCIDT